MVHKKVRVGASVVGVLALMLIVTGCSSEGDAVRVPEVNKSSADPVKVKTDLWRELDAVQELAGGEWTKQDSRIPNQCGKPGKAFSYNGTRVMQEQVADPKALADAVAKSWEEKGFTVSRQSFAEWHFGVTAHLKDGGEFYLSNDGTDHRFFVSGTTGCYPGDYLEIVKNDKKELKEREPLSSPSPSE
ncbi:hypothetical protein M2390_001879 [Mycetocola sp. BIGb0189]|uniref:hypothetical protein n=1 Tax=Mycetocola sp. BIGb0189 TaxID=2940604 RepID=UPI002168FCED|nr:hypothetical protein [Mycetocola sp. BIGb0189]MCS4276685.1 hypothetical protein [Mycetocola sp. BIGb0189]